MKILHVPFLLSPDLDRLEKHTLTYSPWAAYPYNPKVEFSIAFSNDHIFLKYFITEEFIKASVGNTNGPVWEDSCVEFFFSPEENEGYYNFEINCIGTILAEYGNQKANRTLLPEEIIHTIKREVKIIKMAEGIHWELTIAIPFSVFVNHKTSSLKGKQCRANFYKCGDKLPMPHFLSWSNIESPKPNFHLSDYFGSIIFENP